MQSRTQTSTGAPIKTLEMQQAEELARQQAEQQYLAQQAAAQQQPQQPAFPGSAPGAPSDGLLTRAWDSASGMAKDAYNWVDDKLTPDKKLGEMVPAANNPLMHGEGVGVGGEARRRQLEEQERRALEGQMQRQR